MANIIHMNSSWVSTFKNKNPYFQQDYCRYYVTNDVHDYESILQKTSSKEDKLQIGNGNYSKSSLDLLSDKECGELNNDKKEPLIEKCDYSKIEKQSFLSDEEDMEYIQSQHTQPDQRDNEFYNLESEGRESPIIMSDYTKKEEKSFLPDEEDSEYIQSQHTQPDQRDKEFINFDKEGSVSSIIMSDYTKKEEKSFLSDEEDTEYIQSQHTQPDQRDNKFNNLENEERESPIIISDYSKKEEKSFLQDEEDTEYIQSQHTQPDQRDNEFNNLESEGRESPIIMSDYAKKEEKSFLPDEEATEYIQTQHTQPNQRNKEFINFDREGRESSIIMSDYAKKEDKSFLPDEEDTEYIQSQHTQPDQRDKEVINFDREGRESSIIMSDYSKKEEKSFLQDEEATEYIQTQHNQPNQRNKEFINFDRESSIIISDYIKKEEKSFLPDEKDTEYIPTKHAYSNQRFGDFKDPSKTKGSTLKREIKFLSSAEDNEYNQSRFNSVTFKNDNKTESSLKYKYNGSSVSQTNPLKVNKFTFPYHGKSEVPHPQLYDGIPKMEINLYAKKLGTPLPKSHEISYYRNKSLSYFNCSHQCSQFKLNDEKRMTSTSMNFLSQINDFELSKSPKTTTFKSETHCLYNKRDPSLTNYDSKGFSGLSDTKNQNTFGYSQNKRFKNSLIPDIVTDKMCFKSKYDDNNVCLQPYHNNTCKHISFESGDRTDGNCYKPLEFQRSFPSAQKRMIWDVDKQNEIFSSKKHVTSWKTDISLCENCWKAHTKIQDNLYSTSDSFQPSFLNEQVSKYCDSNSLHNTTKRGFRTNYISKDNKNKKINEKLKFDKFDILSRSTPSNFTYVPLSSRTNDENISDLEVKVYCRGRLIYDPEI